MRFVLKGRYELTMKKNLMKILLICLTASMAVSAFGCSKQESSQDSSAENSAAETGAAPQETISLGQTKQPLTFVHDIDDGVDNTEGNPEAQEGAATTAAGGQNEEVSTSVSVVEATEVVAVTDDKGQPATDDKGNQQTEIVKATQQAVVTDTKGNPETNDKGETQTQVVPVTETVIVTEKAESPATLSPNADPGNQTSYTPSYDTCKAYWLDMSQESDFVFEGEFLIFEFEINQDIPDGSYPVTISKTDIASWDLVSLNPKIINGEVAVNTDLKPQEDFPDKDFALKVNSVSAKQGDTVKVAIDIKNNTGFCGFVLDVQYDKSAMTIVDTYGGENFTQSAINYVAN